jgi:selenocysteine lyase/cysteine desulfurase
MSEVRVMKINGALISLSEFEKSIDDDTVAVSVDYVSWFNGCSENIADVTRIAHSHGALTMVDAFHAIGVFPVDVRNLDIDVLVCGTYKWLMGAHWVAYIYVRDEATEQLYPSVVRWHGISDSVISRAVSKEEIFGKPFDLSNVEPARNATKFERGTWSVISVIGSRAALEFTLNHPPSERWPAIQKLTTHLIDELRNSSKIYLPDSRRNAKWDCHFPN